MEKIIYAEEGIYVINKEILRIIKTNDGDMRKRRSKIKISIIPKLGKGGIVDSPTIAMVAEAGEEAVIPSENNTQGNEKKLLYR